MRERSLGRTGIRVSELGLGTWGLSGDGYGPVEEGEAERVILRARSLGITLFETADVYGNGTMETLLGKAFGDQNEVCLVTKLGTNREEVPPRKRFDPTFLKERLERSRDRLRRQTIDLLLLHNPATTTLARGEAVSFLKEEMARSTIRSWGISVGSPEAASAALDADAPVIELAHNLLWTRSLREIEGRLATSGTGILGRSILGHGVLCGLWQRDKVFLAEDHRSERWSPEDLRKRIGQLDAIRPLVGGEVQTLRSVALRWVLCHDTISSAILGPRNSLQLDQLVRDRGNGPPYLPPESLATLEARLADVGARP